MFACVQLKLSETGPVSFRSVVIHLYNNYYGRLEAHYANEAGLVKAITLNIQYRKKNLTTILPYKSMSFLYRIIDKILSSRRSLTWLAAAPSAVASTTLMEASWSSSTSSQLGADHARYLIIMINKWQS